MLDAAQMLADGVAAHDQLVGTYLLAPVIGARRAPAQAAPRRDSSDGDDHVLDAAPAQIPTACSSRSR
jgi:hypothetical protein